MWCYKNNDSWLSCTTLPFFFFQSTLRHANVLSNVQTHFFYNFFCYYYFSFVSPFFHDVPKRSMWQQYNQLWLSLTLPFGYFSLFVLSFASTIFPFQIQPEYSQQSERLLAVGDFLLLDVCTELGERESRIRSSRPLDVAGKNFVIFSGFWYIKYTRKSLRTFARLSILRQTFFQWAGKQFFTKNGPIFAPTEQNIFLLSQT